MKSVFQERARKRKGSYAILLALTVFIVGACALAADAKPAKPGMRTHEQSDGEVIRYQLIGDEFLHYMVDSNGDLVTVGDDGDLYCAEWTDQGNMPDNARAAMGSAGLVVPTKRKPAGAPRGYALSSKDAMKPLNAPIPQHILDYAEKLRERRDSGWRDQNPQKPVSRQKPVSQRPAGAPPASDPALDLVVIYVNFADEDNMPELKGKELQNDFISNIVFGNAPGSLTPYYQKVTGDAVGFKPAEKGKKKDDLDKGIIRVTVPGSLPGYNSVNDEARFAIVKEALAKAAESIDFSAYDSDHDGILSPLELSILLVIHGYEAADIGDLNLPGFWAHAFTFVLENNFRSDEDPVYKAPKFDGVEVPHYCSLGAFTTKPSADPQDLPSPFSLGTAAHEMGHHSFGFLDFYKLTPENRTCGITGNWSLMGMGSNTFLEGTSTPTALDAYHLSRIVAPEATVTLGDLGKAPNFSLDFSLTDSSQFIKVETDNPQQYFLLQARGQVGWDRGLLQSAAPWSPSAGGLMIYHIDEALNPETIAGNPNEIWKTHPFMDIEKHDPQTYLQDPDTYFGTPDDLFFEGKTFDHASSPNSNLYDAPNLTTANAASRVVVTNFKPTVTNPNTPDGSVTVQFTVKGGGNGGEGLESSGGGTSGCDAGVVGLAGAVMVMALILRRKAFIDAPRKRK